MRDKYVCLMLPVLIKFLQNLVDNLRLSRYVEIRDLLMDDMCVLVGIDVCPQACLSDRR